MAKRIISSAEKERLRALRERFCMGEYRVCRGGTLPAAGKGKTSSRAAHIAAKSERIRRTKGLRRRKIKIRSSPHGAPLSPFYLNF